MDRIQVSSLVEEARHQIRRSILSGRLRPGERLKDSVLAEQMGISRSPVREALRSLEQAGLVEKAANRSYRIPTFAPEDIRELAALRAADEILAVRVILATRPSLDRLDAAIDQLRATGDDAQRSAVADTAFHRAVVELAALPRLLERYDAIIDQIRLVLLAGEVEIWGSDERIVQNHLHLLAMLRAAYGGSDALDLIRGWEQHVLAGMAMPGVVDPL